MDGPALVDALFRAIDAHDVAAVRALASSDFVCDDVAMAEPYCGPAGAAAWLGGYLEAFPDLRVALMQTVGEGAEVAAVWRASGTHQGWWLNIPPTGRSIEVSGVTVLAVRSGAVHRALSVWDVAGALRDLGLLPRLPAGGVAVVSRPAGG